MTVESQSSFCIAALLLNAENNAFLCQRNKYVLTDV